MEYSTPIQVQATNLSSSSQHHHVTVTKNLVPSKIVGLKPVVSTSTMVRFFFSFVLAFSTFIKRTKIFVFRSSFIRTNEKFGLL